MHVWSFKWIRVLKRLFTGSVSLNLKCQIFKLIKPIGRIYVGGVRKFFCAFMVPPQRPISLISEKI